MTLVLTLVLTLTLARLPRPRLAPEAKPRPMTRSEYRANAAKYR